jgi:hypothetical protein
VGDGRAFLGLSVEHDETLRLTVSEVASILQDLHRTLMNSALGTYERDIAPIGGPGQRLQLLMYDPEFRWLRTLSGLMADIDELVDSGFLSPVDAAAVRDEVSRLITPVAGDESEFARRYLEMLQADPSVVMAHAKVRQSLNALPVADPAQLDEVRGARLQWPSRRKNRRKSI